MKEEEYDFQDKMNSSEPDNIAVNGKPTMSKEEAMKKLGFEDENIDNK